MLTCFEFKGMATTSYCHFGGPTVLNSSSSLKSYAMLSPSQ